VDKFPRVHVKVSQYLTLKRRQAGIKSRLKRLKKIVAVNISGKKAGKQPRKIELWWCTGKIKHQILLNDQS